MFVHYANSKQSCIDSVKYVFALSGNCETVSLEQQDISKRIHDPPNLSGTSIDTVRHHLRTSFIIYPEYNVKEAQPGPVMSAERTYMPESMLLLEGSNLE